MSLSFQIQRSPQYWITECVVASILTVINTRILYKQIKALKSPSSTNRKPLQITSLCCMVSGLIYSFSICLRYIPYIQWCRIWIAVNYTWLNIPIFTGFYQLTRLWLCFSEQEHQTHASQIAYPLYVFILMAFIGISLLITTSIITPYFLATTQFIVPRECGVLAHSLYFSQTFVVDPPGMFPVSARIVWLVANFIYLIWDITTLLLYVWSIRALSQKYASQNQLTAKQRTLRMLYQVLIPTVFYETITFLWILSWLADRFVFPTVDTMPVLSAVIVVSVHVYSMHLMTDGGRRSYLGFLKCIRALKLHWICCGWRVIVDDQIDELTHKINLQVAAKQQEETTTTTVAVTGSEQTEDATVSGHAPSREMEIAMARATASELSVDVDSVCH